MSSIKHDQPDIGVGATEELNLRVSVAALVRVRFAHPEDGRAMLALERTATLGEVEGKSTVDVKAKPFGGGVRLKDPGALQRQIGKFHFDSPRSRDEMDFRIQIRARDWLSVKAFCLQHFLAEDGILESRPERELVEEFMDALNIGITPDQYSIKPIGLVVENRPSKTGNVRAAGNPTVRIYHTFEMLIEASSLITEIITNSQSYGDAGLQELAWQDARGGGKGRANAVLALTMDSLTKTYRAIPFEQRGGSIRVGEHLIDGNVLAILEGIDTAKYQRIRIAGSPLI